MKITFVQHIFSTNYHNITGISLVLEKTARASLFEVRKTLPVQYLRKGWWN